MGNSTKKTVQWQDSLKDGLQQQHTTFKEKGSGERIDEARLTIESFIGMKEAINEIISETKAQIKVLKKELETKTLDGGEISTKKTQRDKLQEITGKLQTTQLYSVKIKKVFSRNTQKLNKLAKSLTEATGKLGKQSKSVNALKEQLQEYKSKMEEKGKQLTEQEGKIETLTAVKKDLEDRLSEDKIKQSKDEIVTLKKELTELQNNSKGTEDEIDAIANLSTKIEEKENKITKEEDISQLKQSLINAEKELKEAKTSIKQTRKTFKKDKQKVNSTEKKLKKSQAKEFTASIKLSEIQVLQSLQEQKLHELSQTALQKLQDTSKSLIDQQQLLNKYASPTDREQRSAQSEVIIEIQLMQEKVEQSSAKMEELIARKETIEKKVDFIKQQIPEHKENGSNKLRKKMLTKLLKELDQATKEVQEIETQVGIIEHKGFAEKKQIKETITKQLQDATSNLLDTTMHDEYTDVIKYMNDTLEKNDQSATSITEAKLKEWLTTEKSHCQESQDMYKKKEKPKKTKKSSKNAETTTNADTLSEAAAHKSQKETMQDTIDTMSTFTDIDLTIPSHVDITRQTTEMEQSSQESLITLIEDNGKEIKETVKDDQEKLQEEKATNKDDQEKLQEEKATKSKKPNIITKAAKWLDRKIHSPKVDISATFSKDEGTSVQYPEEEVTNTKEEQMDLKNKVEEIAKEQGFNIDATLLTAVEDVDTTKDTPKQDATLPNQKSQQSDQSQAL